MILAWTCTLITSFFSIMVIKYPSSKPLLYQTVMDVANKAGFVSLIVTNILLALIVTISNSCSDAGESVALPLAWLFFFSTTCTILGAIFIVTVQLMIVQRPSILESDTFERFVKFMVVVALPFLCAALCLVLSRYGSKPYVYFHLRGTKKLPKRDVLLDVTGASLSTIFILQFVLSRYWIKRKGFYMNAESNHIIQSKVIAVIALFGSASYVLVGFKWTETDLFKEVVLVFYSLFSIMTVFVHNSLNSYAMRRSPFCQLLSVVEWLSKVRNSRRVATLHESRELQVFKKQSRYCLKV